MGVKFRAYLQAGVAVLVTTAGFMVVQSDSPAMAHTRHLTRYPYLTDVVRVGSRTNATLNWGTDRSHTTGYATYGRSGKEPCTAHRANGSKISVTVNKVPEYQWKAKITSLSPGNRYCYRIFFSHPVTDLLGNDPSPVFMASRTSKSSIKFAVWGDWGQTDASGTNPSQAKLDRLIAGSGAQFGLGTGDTAYGSPSETTYGDLYQTGKDISTVFGPSFYKDIGDKMPFFNALGNHGLNATFQTIWPEYTAASLSLGREQMDTYCCVNGTTSKSYPSVWYAFSIGNTRFYVLDATWEKKNLGNGTIYSNDFAAHWKSTAPEYRWLASDLASHPGGLKFVVAHFPMYSDAKNGPTDTYLHGPGSLAALLTKYHVQMVFNGHAHIYERNFRQPGDSFVSYVTGGGGATLYSVGSKCSAFDAYALGFGSSNTGSACGSAPRPTSRDQVFNFLLVTVDGGRVTVTPTNANGTRFDVHTYHF